MEDEVELPDDVQWWIDGSRLLFVLRNEGQEALEEKVHEVVAGKMWSEIKAMSIEWPDEVCDALEDFFFLSEPSLSGPSRRKSSR